MNLIQTVVIKDVKEFAEQMLSALKKQESQRLEEEMKTLQEQVAANLLSQVVCVQLTEVAHSTYKTEWVKTEAEFKEEQHRQAEDKDSSINMMTQNPLANRAKMQTSGHVSQYQENSNDFERQIIEVALESKKNGHETILSGDLEIEMMLSADELYGDDDMEHHDKSSSNVVEGETIGQNETNGGLGGLDSNTVTPALGQTRLEYNFKSSVNDPLNVEID